MVKLFIRNNGTEEGMLDSMIISKRTFENLGNVKELKKNKIIYQE